MEVLLITLNTQVLGISLDQTHHITEMPQGFACMGNSERHFVFQDKPLKYVSLWDELKQPSAYADYEEILEIFPKRRQDHLDWLDSLETSIRTGTPFQKARNPHDCSFGKWYYKYHPSDQQLLSSLRQFEEPHTAIHALADHLLELTEQGGREEALATLEYVKSTTFSNLIYLFNSVPSFVRQLIRRVAIIVGQTEASCALGADGVCDIINVRPDQITWLSESTETKRQKSQTISGLIILEDSSVAPLIDWCALTSESGSPDSLGSAPEPEEPLVAR